VIVTAIICLICFHRLKPRYNMNSCVIRTCIFMCSLEFSYQTVFIVCKLTGICVGGKVYEVLCIIYEFPSTKDHAMAHMFGWQPVTTEMWISFWVSVCEICGGQNGNGTGFSQTASVFPCHYHSTYAPYLSSSYQ
jgi:hypothetical protein